jgi:hypothetical protein
MFRMSASNHSHNTSTPIADFGQTSTTIHINLGTDPLSSWGTGNAMQPLLQGGALSGGVQAMLCNLSYKVGH